MLVVAMQQHNHRQQLIQLDTPLAHNNLLHQTPHGHVLCWEKPYGDDFKGKWHKISPKHDSIYSNNLLVGLSEKKDTYFSVNEFSGWRLQRLLKSLRACFVDIDLGEVATRYDLEEAISLLHDKKMPSPNLAIFSGRGLHLYWLLQPTSTNALPLWQAIENNL